MGPDPVAEKAESQQAKDLAECRIGEFDIFFLEVEVDMVGG